MSSIIHHMCGIGEEILLTGPISALIKNHFKSLEELQIKNI